MAVFLTTCLLAITGCSTAKPHKAGTAPALTAWQQVLGEVSRDGKASAATALKAFALAYGSLPGMSVPTGTTGRIRSGSVAIRWLVGHWAEITAEQRAAAVALVPELGNVAPRTHKRVMPADYAAPKRPPTYYTVLAMQMADEIEAHVHVPLTLKLRAAEGRTQQAKALADTGVYNAAGGTTGTADKCVITVSATGAAEQITDLEDTIGHEVWHCYQGQIIGMDAYYDPATPSWIIEGQAEWVGDSLRPIADAASPWHPYVTLPGTSLFKRSYDAIGFYSHLTESGVDTWLSLIPMLQETRGNEARYAKAGATSDVFLDTWASTYFRESSYGPAWLMNGPGLPSTRGPVRLVLSVANGGGKNFKAPAYANAVYSLSSLADVLMFTVTGHARLGDPAKHADYVLTSGDSFCTKDGGCTCPVGSTYQGPSLKALASESALAVTGGPEGSSGSAAGQSLDDFCKKPPPDTKLALPDPCKIVTQADASKAAGRPARPGIPSSATLEGSTVGGLGTGPGCIYRDAGSPSATYGVAYVRVDVYDLGAAAAATLVSYRGRFAGIGTGQAKGLGDDNFYFSINGPTHLYVRRANLILHFAVLTADGLNQSTGLAKIALNRL